jgi:sugar-specific transcriptional regulator TrmB
MLESLLDEAGLNDKERAAYLALLSCGLRQTSFIARRASLNRGTAYVALHSLLRKGLVTKTVRRKVQYFSVKDPESLLRFVGGQITNLQEKYGRLQNEIEKLRQLMKPAGAAPVFEIFEGAEGARAALEDTLHVKEGVLRAFLSLSDVQEFLGFRWFDEYASRRIKNKIGLKAIRTREKDKEAKRVNALAKKYITKKADLREIRHVSDDLAFPITMYVYDDKITIISSKQENFALIIRSNELSQMQRKLFDLFWKDAC